MGLDIADLVDLILAVGTILYAYKMTATTKGGALERGMKLMVLSLVFLLLSIIADAFDDLGFGAGVFDTAHDIILAVFILIMFFGMMTLARDASNYLRSVRP